MNRRDFVAATAGIALSACTATVSNAEEEIIYQDDVVLMNDDMIPYRLLKPAKVINKTLIKEGKERKISILAAYKGPAVNLETNKIVSLKVDRGKLFGFLI